MTAFEHTRALALALPHTAERESHGAPGFHIVGGRFFAYFRDNHHGDGERCVVVKTTGTEEAMQLIELDPALYFRPAYLGPAGWIAIRLDARTDWERVGDRIAASWKLVAPRRLREGSAR